eukprot:CAMPEP_0182449226 /NCGR_PEP_ID=MMETSP1172-20130603/32606_1 /TAXON_ID=708627 /ORGANISM="Timspurckia oligopyrenoides, Strain CCMP3278" /LENGTH=233 /DNA_ID=CAMNT_0024646405 /DNA_START=87 /DNA_END=788 /DNA_ORIENTATION=-
MPEYQLELFCRSRISKNQSRFHDLAIVRWCGKLNDDYSEMPKVLLEYKDGTSFHSKPDLLIGILSPSYPTIILVPELDIYRTLSKSQIYAPTHRFLEIGCANGVTVFGVAKYTQCSIAVGIDKGFEPIIQARDRHSHPNARFLRMDILEKKPETWSKELYELLTECMDSSCALDPLFSHVFIDINGSRPIEDLQRTVQRVILYLRPQMICIKTSKWVERMQSNTCDVLRWKTE